MSELRKLLADADATTALGATLAASAPEQALVFLRGELGAGKTTLTGGFLRALGHEGACRSPTYTLVEPYRVGSLQVYHFDLYRLADPEELEFIGVRDYLAETAICIVEWPEKAAGMLPGPDLDIELVYRDGGREVMLHGNGESGKAWLQRLAPTLDLV